MCMCDALQANSLTAGLGAANIGLYAGIYTPLKALTPANTWVGAVVGAVPPLMGWAAASGGRLDWGALVPAAALYFWQLPHFLAIAWLCREDYARGGCVLNPSLASRILSHAWELVSSNSKFSDG